MLARSPLPPSLPFPPVFRETTAERVNAIVNHEAVRPHITMPGQGALDFSAFIADPRNVALTNEAGTVAILFDRHEAGVFEAHTVSLPEARGRECFAVVRSMVSWMFTASDAMELVTIVPVTNRPAEALAQRVGGVLDFEQPPIWPTESGLVGVKCFRINYSDWVRTAELPAIFGAWFRGRITDECARLGIPAPPLPAAYDPFIGAPVAMMLSGQPAKGIALHNRFARVARQPLASVLNLDPLMLELNGLTLRVHSENPNFEVLPCLPAQ